MPQFHAGGGFPSALRSCVDSSSRGEGEGAKVGPSLPRPCRLKKRRRSPFFLLLFFLGARGKGSHNTEPEREEKAPLFEANAHVVTSKA